MQNDKAKFKKEFVKRLIRFSLDVINLCDTLPKDKKYWTICDQLIRSATSVGANVVEAQSSGSRKDYARFFDIALKSANETKYWLIIVRELNGETRDRANTLLNEVDELSRVIGASLLTLRGKR